MLAARILTLLGVVVMAVSIAYGFAAGGGWAEVGRMVAMPGGLVTLIDIYVGFALFSGWVIYRERCVWRSALWVVLVMTLGNFATCLYAALALGRSGGDWARFWQGRRAPARPVN